MKKTRYILIGILCVLAVTLSGVMAWALKSDRSFKYSPFDDGYFHAGGYKLALEKELPAEGIESLNVQYDMSSNDVCFYTHQKDTIIVKEYLNFTAEEEQLSTVTVNGNVLKIEGKRRSSGSFFGVNCGGSFSGGGYTEIYLPKAFFADYTVSTISGQIEFNGVEAGELHLSSVSGDIRVPSATGKAEISTTSGDVFLEKSEGERSIFTVSGDIHLTDSEGALTAGTTSGDIFIDVQKGVVSVNTVSGDVTIWECNDSVEVGTTSGDVKVIARELSGTLSVGTVSGDVTLSLPEEAVFDFEYDSVSGDCDTFFDNELSYNKRGNSAHGVHGTGGQNKVAVSTTSGDLRVFKYGE